MRLQTRLFQSISFCLAGFLSVFATALSAPLIEDFDDGSFSFQEGATTSHTIGGGVSDYTWTIVNASGGNKVLRSHIFFARVDGR